MKNRDWLVTQDGNCIACESDRDWDLLRNEYRLYRFLTEVEDVVNVAQQQGETQASFLPQLRKLVRQLILNSYWVKTRSPEPNPKTGTSILLLYEELGFPMTVQTETMLSGADSPIHNHGTWGVVAVLRGQQKNTFWKRSSKLEASGDGAPTAQFPDKIELVGEKILRSGEIISFTSEAIHAVEAVGDEAAVTFNLYGETDANNRFQFDAVNHKAKHF